MFAAAADALEDVAIAAQLLAQNEVLRAQLQQDPAEAHPEVSDLPKMFLCCMGGTPIALSTAWSCCYWLAQAVSLADFVFRGSLQPA